MGIMGFSWDSIGIRIMGWNGYHGNFSNGDMMEISNLLEGAGIGAD
jgi:hypothetical protein